MHNLKFLEASALSELPEKTPLGLPPVAETYAAFISNFKLAVNLGALPSYAVWVSEQWILASLNAHPPGTIATAGEDTIYNIRRADLFIGAVKKEPFKDRMVDKTDTIELLVKAGPPSIHAIFHGLLKSIVTQSYTALEILIGDLYQKSRIKYEHLFPAKKYTFASRARFRKAYKETFSDAALDSILLHDSVEALCLLRNVIVHKSGVTDTEFMSNDRKYPGYPFCDLLKRLWPGLTEGKEIPLDGAKVSEIINPAMQQAFELAAAMERWLKPRI